MFKTKDIPISMLTDDFIFKALDYLPETVDLKTGCWIPKKGNNTDYKDIGRKSTGTVKNEGRTEMWFYGKHWKLPRIIYSIFRGHIGSNLVTDHLDEICTSTLCCNPWHLELITNQDNRRRAKNKVCINGHIQTPENRKYFKSKLCGFTSRCKLCKY